MKLSLAQKGPIAPPPVLAPPLERVSLAIRSWPGVIAAAHWDLFEPDRIDGADFYVGDEELGHLHCDGGAHLATVRSLSAPLIAAGLARRPAFGTGSYDGWCEYSVRGETETDHALWLFRLNYDRLTGTDATVLTRRIATAHRPEQRR